MGGKDNPPPDEWLTYLVMDKLHKFESEVMREPARDIYRLLTIMSVEAEVQEAKRTQRV